MKAILFVVLAALSAVTLGCGKKNDVHVLHEEVASTIKYYQPRLDTLDTRVQAIFKRGSSIPGNLPGIEDVGKRLQEARDTIVQLRGVIGKGPDGSSAAEKQAEALAKEGNAEKLAKLLHDTEGMLERGITIVNDDLDSVESWIANYDRKTLALNTVAAAATEPTPPPGAPTPEAAANPTGQPPPAAQGSAAAQGSGAAPAPQAGSGAQAGSAAPAKAPAKAPETPAKAPAKAPKAPAPKP